MSGDPAPRPKKVLSYSLSRQIRSEDPRPLEAVSAGFALPVPLPRRAAGWQPSQARLPSHTGHLFARTAPAVSPPSAWSQPSGPPPAPRLVGPLAAPSAPRGPALSPPYFRSSSPPSGRFPPAALHVLLLTLSSVDHRRSGHPPYLSAGRPLWAPTRSF